MIENIMLAGLGFFAATLLALLCLPAVWGRATRLTRRRLEMLVPLSMAEIAAERDGIRAKAAVVQRQLEQQLERAVQAATEASTELGRRTSQLVSVERMRDKISAERGALSSELSRTKSDLVEAEGQCSALKLGLQDLERRFQSTEDERRELLRKRDELETLMQERRATIASLETRREGSEARVADLHADLERSRNEQSTLRAALADRTRERDTGRNEVLLANTQRAILQSQLQDESRRSEEYSVRWMAKSEALARAERRIMEQAAEIRTATAALADLKLRFEALEARLIDSPAAGQAAQEVSDTELSELRASIVGVADDAIRLLREPDSVDQPDPVPVPVNGSNPASTESGQRNTGALL